MKQFFSVLRFELNGYFKSKLYTVMTLVFVVVLAGLLSFPNIKSLFASEEAAAPEAPVTEVSQLTDTADDPEALAIVNVNGAFSDEALVMLAAGMNGRAMKLVTDDEATVREQVQAGVYAGAVILRGADSVTYIARNLGLTDTTVPTLYEAVTAAARYERLSGLNLPAADVNAIVNPAINIGVDNLGVSETDTFFYTYVMLMALYMAIMIYGQIVATSVATEKGSRTMELLITSTGTNALLFGKTIAAALSGLIQMGAIFGSAVLFYHLNASAWAGNEIIASIFNMPLPVVGYVLVFFFLGFFLYAFMYGAIGSLVSRIEDVSAAIMPVLMCFVAAFIIVISAVSSGNADSSLMIVCSYIPLTSPMAMFARIAMSSPAWYEVVISIALLLATTVGIGVLSAGIYRMGVLMYGKTPKPAELLRIIRLSRKRAA